MIEPNRLLASFGRRRGRRLRPTREGLMEEVMPQLALRDEEMRRWRDEENFFSYLFPRIATFSYPRIFLEIGFGGGEHLAHQAALNPDVGIIGCEPFINGVAALLRLLTSPSPGQARGLNNVRIFNDDARLLLAHVPNATLDRVFILYPDPWPKARHHKRRLISKEFLDILARVMKPGAELRLATDHSDYCTWMLERLLAYPAFEWTAKDCDDWLKPWADWIPTRYEQKRLAGMPTYLTFKRM